MVDDLFRHVLWFADLDEDWIHAFGFAYDLEKN